MATPDTSSTVESKVVASAAVTAVASVLLAVLTALSDQPDLLASWPPVWRFVVIAALPPVLTLLAGYMKSSNRV